MSSVTTKPTVHAFQTDDARLRPVHEKILSNHRLDAADLHTLYESKDILALGWLANHVRERMHGNTTRFEVDRIVASEAVRSAGCSLCGRTQAAVEIEPQIEQVGSNINEFVVLADGTTNFDRLLRGIETLKKQYPQASVSALTVEEIAAATTTSNVIAEDICRSLTQVGAHGLIGGGAEVFVPALRHCLWHHSGTAEQRVHVRHAAKSAGLAIPLFVVQREAATPEQRAAELLGFRDGAASFAALSFDPDASTSLNTSVSTGMQEMKQIAIARLALDSATHIRTYWQMLGGKLLQIALRFGASELDGTSLDTGVNHEIRRRELAREIQVAGREAQETPSTRKAILLA